MMWSEYVNGYVYQFVASVLRASQAHNITIDGGVKYNVPSGSIVIDGIGNSSPPALTSYTTTAIIGADDFDDDDTTLSEVFDIFVNVTRQITPTCTFLDRHLSVSFFFLICPQFKSELSGALSMYKGGIPEMLSDKTPQFLCPIWVARPLC